MGRIGGSKRVTFGMLAALAAVLVIFYFVTAGRSSDGGDDDDDKKTGSKANFGNGQATASLRGTLEPSSEFWSSTATPTALVFDADAFDWDELPPFAQSAASTLGYDQASWDADSLPLRPWSSLSLAEKEAAMALGYDPGYWNEMAADSTTAIAVPEEVRDYHDDDEGGSSTATPTEVAWDGLDWEDLPPEIRDAAGRLGYDERTWDDDDAVFPGIERRWIDLTAAEQAAAKTLGWNEAYWEDVIYRGPPEEATSDPTTEEPTTEEPTTEEPTSEAWLEDDDEGGGDDDDDDDTGTSAPSTETSLFEWEYASYEWEELPNDVRESAELLGWDELTWCDGDPLPLRQETRWDGLSEAQKVAAAALGFSEPTWDDVRRFLRRRAP